jgi:hypothetical protein
MMNTSKITVKISKSFSQCTKFLCQLEVSALLTALSSLYTLHSTKYLHIRVQSTEQCLASPQSTYFPRDKTGLVCLPTRLEHTMQLYW